MIVKYSRAFPLAAYGINEHIGFELEIPDESDEQKALQTLRELAELSFKTAHPTVILQTPVEEVLSKEEIAANTLKAISECATKEELEAFKLLKCTDKLIFNAYTLKEKSLIK